VLGAPAALGASRRGVRAARATGALSPGDIRRLFVGRGGGERWGWTLPERWEPLPPSPKAAEAAEETAPRAGAGAPATRQPMREATRAAGASARAAGMTGGAAVATPAAATTSAKPPRKRKRGFSTLR
jgi:hypothetical protein